MVLPIFALGSPFLRRVCKPVKSFDGALSKLCRDMVETMYDAKGIGLAASQVGILQQLFVMDTEQNGQWKVFINPKIVKKSEEVQSYEEGCLSIPNFLYQFSRPAEIELKYYDLEGTRHKTSLSGIEAVCAQHEIDHLYGKLFIDYIPKAEKPEALKKMLEIGFSDTILYVELMGASPEKESAEKKQTEQNSID